MSASEQGVSLERYMFVPRTLIIVTKGNKILLLKGAKNKRLWAGLYNGVGGHVEKGEDILASAVRELFEETAISVDSLYLCGIVTVDTQTNPGVCIFIFKGNYTGGNFRISKEGTLEWVERSDLYELPLVADLPILLPMILSHARNTQPFIAHSSYDEDGKINITLA